MERFMYPSDFLKLIEKKGPLSKAVFKSLFPRDFLAIKLTDITIFKGVIDFGENNTFETEFFSTQNYRHFLTPKQNRSSFESHSVALYVAKEIKINHLNSLENYFSSLFKAINIHDLLLKAKPLLTEECNSDIAQCTRKFQPLVVLMIYCMFQQHYSNYARSLIQEYLSTSTVFGESPLPLYSFFDKYLTKVPSIMNLCCREAEIDALLNKIQKEPVKVVLTGIGGIGKSSIARKLFHTLKEDYDYIGWIEYNSSLKDSLISSIKMTNFQPNSPESRFEYIMHFLRNDTKKKLLIIDDINIDTYEDEDLEELISLDHLTVIATSRWDDIEGFKPFPINPLNFNQCIDLFYYYYNKQNINNNSDIVTDLINQVHCHTLCIEILAKAAKREPNLNEYYEKIRVSGLTSIKKRVEGKNIQERLRCLYQIEDFSSSPEHYRILWNFALMPTIDIPKTVIKWIDADENVIEELIQSGWLSDHGDSYYMHAIISEIIHFDFDKISPIEILDKYLLCVKNKKYFSSFEEYSLKEKKLNILNYIIENSIKKESKEYANYSFELAYIYSLAGFHTKAISYYLNSEKIYQKMSNVPPNRFACIAHYLAKEYEHINNLDLAFNEYSKALEIYESSLVSDDPRIWKIKVKLSYIRYQKGENIDLVPYFERWIDAAISTWGKNSDKLYPIYNFIALYYQETLNFEASKHYYKIAINLLETYYDGFSPGIGTCYLNFGSLMIATEQFDEAQKYLEKALNNKQQLFGQNSLTTIKVYIQLGILYSCKNDYDNSKHYLMTALELLRNCEDANTITYMSLYTSIGILCRETQDYLTAEKYFKQTLSLAETEISQYRYTLANARETLGNLYLDMNKIDNAENLIKIAYMHYQALYGDSNSITLIHARSIGRLYLAQGDIKNAIYYLIKSYRIRLQVYGENHQYTKKTLEYLEEAYHRSNHGNKDFNSWLTSLK
ncbi:MAG: tetratricopeptide repeat protein [Lachnospiraceae bacterium]